MRNDMYMQSTSAMTTSLLMLFCTGCSTTDEPTTSSDKLPCGDLIYTGIEWDATTTAGLNPSEIFEPIQRTCSGWLEWDTSSRGRGTPAIGEDEISVTLTFDTTTAEVGNFEKPEAEAVCGESFLEVRAHVEISTANGFFSDEGDIPIGYSESEGISIIRLMVPIEEIGGTFKVEPEAEETASFWYDIGNTGEACEGEIRYKYLAHLDDGHSESGGFIIGQWTDFGAPDAG